MGLLSALGRMGSRGARAVRASQLGQSPGNHSVLGNMADEAVDPLMQSAQRRMGGQVPDIGGSGMSELETEIVRRFQQGQRPEQIAMELYGSGMKPEFVDAILRRAQRNLMQSGNLF